ncbi:hypothetical protein FB561_4639 [Kribbella amoyensis]|uniref:DUF6458 domain-containing protein n=1 Tax=Kribbella amoyensis TaxID=996641 RepID=A0A561BX52_9ACTN|nr:DUF6458 family protein [Kribbella amoyensis]TWD83476.1 hypothetical protein FB561_4639 [Kribbella amoyensis]
MSIGVGIFLIAAGAILAFGIRDTSSTVNLTVVGVVIMLAGAAGIWLSYHLTNAKRRVRNSAIDPAVEEEYRIVEDDLATETRPVEPKQTPVTERPVTDKPAVEQPATEQRAAEQRVAEQPVAEETAVERTVVEGGPSEEYSEEVSADARTIDLDPTASGLPEHPVRRRVRR